LLQSSTATALIISTFCGRGLLTVSAGIAVMLGADVGTTLVAQVLAFDFSWLAPLFIITGFVLFTIYERAGPIGHIGKALLGLGLMLFALIWIKESAKPLQESVLLPEILQSLANDPVLAVILAAIMTWMAHSSLAIVLLILSFVVTGVIPVEVSLYMVLGANLGGTIAPIVATLKDKAAAARVPVGNMIIKLIGVIILFQFIDEVNVLLTTLSPDPSRMVVNFHTAFNVGLAIIFLPFTSVIAGICNQVLPDKKDDNNPESPKYLDNKELDTPTIALASASREALRMADILEEMLESTIKAFQENDMALVKRIKKEDNTLDALHKEIKLYMAKVSQEAMDHNEGLLSIQILSFATNIEHAGDIIDKGLMVMADKKIKNQNEFSEEGMKEIENIHYLVLESVRLAQSVFVSGDAKLARQIIEGKERLREAEQNAVANHFERLRDSVKDTIATSSLHIDIIRDYIRVNTHMCTVAYPILEETGQLRTTRLKPVTKKSKKKENK
jgi:phosphate:Na+ symporter